MNKQILLVFIFGVLLIGSLLIFYNPKEEIQIEEQN
jgi:hypothetical protein